MATLVDVRRYPGSRRNPQFNQAALAAALAEAGIEYRHAVELGGLRSNEPGEERFACLGAFAGYAARMGTPEWQDALALALDEPAPVLSCAPRRRGCAAIAASSPSSSSRAVTRSSICSARASESRTGPIRPPRCATDSSTCAEASSASGARDRGSFKRSDSLNSLRARTGSQTLLRRDMSRQRRSRPDHHRRRAGRVHGRPLRCAREPESARDRRRHLRRPADDHERRRELPRLSRAASSARR